MKRGIRIALAASLLLVSLWMSYDNVFSDIAPIQAQAEQAACSIEKCAEQHGVTKVDRSFYDQTFAIEWKASTVDVECHRELYVAGSRVCSAKKR